MTVFPLYSPFLSFCSNFQGNAYFFRAKGMSSRRAACSFLFPNSLTQHDKCFGNEDRILLKQTKKLIYSKKLWFVLLNLSLLELLFSWTKLSCKPPGCSKVDQNAQGQQAPWDPWPKMPWFYSRKQMPWKVKHHLLTINEPKLLP